MIFDAIIGAFTSLAELLTAAVLAASVAILNATFAVVELIAGIFVAGFTIKRIEHRRTKPRSTASNAFVWAALGLIVVAIVLPLIMKRTVTLVAEDGHSLPFAAVMIHTNDEADRSERTDSAGNIRIPRFGIHAVSVKDPRYVEQTWSKADIEPRLVVRRTVLGSGLDHLAKQLLAPDAKSR
jgi:hypothetical protein